MQIKEEKKTVYTHVFARVLHPNPECSSTYTTTTVAAAISKSKSSTFRRVHPDIPKAKVHIPMRTSCCYLCAFSYKYEFPVAFTFNLQLSIQFGMKTEEKNNKSIR